MNLLPLLITFGVFLPLAWLARSHLRLQSWPTAWALLNLATLLPLCTLAGSVGVRSHYLEPYLEAIAVVYVIYVLLVLIEFLLIQRFGVAPTWHVWIPILFPIAILIIIKLAPASLLPSLRGYGFLGKRMTELFIGISYLTFRLSRLALEVRSGAVQRPSLSNYLAFSFFVPTLAVGPISPYGVYSSNPDRAPIEPQRAALRMLVGFTKYLFLANIVNQLSYASLLLDGHLHHFIDLPVAMLATYLFLYLNFSGYCDMAIGAAGLLGVPVSENFDSPFAARNVRDFWNRWHITLSQFVRDLIFTPFSKVLVRWLGPRHVNHAVALAILPVFVVIGLWHGIAWNFFIFGVLHSAAVIANHYYTGLLRSRLGNQGLARYNANALIRAAAVIATFTYVAFTIMFFSNSLSDLQQIVTALR